MVLWCFDACKDTSENHTIVILARENGNNETVLEIKMKLSRVNGMHINCIDYIHVTRNSLNFHLHYRSEISKRFDQFE